MAIPLRDNAPSYDVPWMNLGIIGTCILVFLWQLNYPGGIEASREVWGEVPWRITFGQSVPGTSISAWVTVFTSMWMHAGFDHIVGNLYGLWLFGDNVEWLLGRWRYLLFYITCGLLAGLATVLLGSQSQVAGLGASGAISGVLAAYLLVYPRALITSLVWVDPWSLGHAMYGDWGLLTRNISALWFIGSWVLFQVLFTVYALASGVWLNLGIYAHATGVLAGAILVWPLMIKARRPSPDSYTQIAELTAPVIGEAGDAGEGGEPVASLDEEVERLHSIHARRHVPQAEFHDYRAEELIAQDRLEEALDHCRDMLAMAQDSGDWQRAAGYKKLLMRITAQIRAQHREVAAQAKREGVDTATYNQRLEEVKARMRGYRLSEPRDWP